MVPFPLPHAGLGDWDRPGARNGERTVVIRYSANWQPLRATHYSLRWHSPIHANIHPPTAGSSAQGDSRTVGAVGVRRGAQGRRDGPSSLEEPGVGPATHRLQGNPPHL